MGCRNIEKGQEAVKLLQADNLNQVEPVEIDVDDINSIKAAREVVG